MTSTQLKIDIVSDVVCPWCAVGYQRLKAAIDQEKLQDKVEIEWHPFELNPNMPAEGENLRSHLIRKYGISTQDSIHNRNQLIQLGNEVGFQFNFSDDMTIVNTRKAHTLLELAKHTGQQTQLKLALLTAYFTDGQDVSTQSVLEKIAHQVGLDPLQVQSTLTDPYASERVAEKEQHWLKLGVNGVPTMVFNQQSALTGAQSVAIYAKILKDLIA